MNTQKEGINIWLNYANADYETAFYNFEGARYPWALYIMLQALEKLIKAAIVANNKEIIKSHELNSLAEETNLNFSKEQIVNLKELNRDYKRIRYPDYQQNKYNTKEKVEPLLKQAEEIYLWILQQLKTY